LIGVAFIKLVVRISNVVTIITIVSVVDTSIVFVPVIVIIERVICSCSRVLVHRINISVVVPPGIVEMAVIIRKIAATVAKDDMEISVSVMLADGSFTWNRRRLRIKIIALIGRCFFRRLRRRRSNRGIKCLRRRSRYLNRTPGELRLWTRVLARALCASSDLDTDDHNHDGRYKRC